MKGHNELLFGDDWQTLIILDACRADMFYQVYENLGLGGWLPNYDHYYQYADNGQCVNTEHWYWRHLDRPMDDITLVSGHPIAWGLNSKKDGRLMKLWFREAIDCWRKDDFPEPRGVLEVAVHPIVKGRRMIHLIPPHLPWLSLNGKALLERLGATSDEYGFKGGDPTCYDLVEAYGKAGNWEELRRLYRENVAYGLLNIERYIDRLPSPIVITADHGEFIGEFDRYNHNMLHGILTSVPWLKLTRK